MGKSVIAGANLEAACRWASPRNDGAGKVYLPYKFNIIWLLTIYLQSEPQTFYLLLFTSYMTDIALFGVQWAGKGTQAQLICEFFKQFALFETGSIFRALSTLNNRVGEYVRQINQGNYIHYSVTNWVFDLMIPMLDENQNILFDGYPRDLPQLFHLLDFEHKHHRKLIGIHLKLDDKTAMERLVGRKYYKKDGRSYLIKNDDELKLIVDQWYEIVIREDDHPDAIRKRIDQYHRETEPIIEYLKKQDMLIEIDASQTPEAVFEEIRKLLKLSI